MGEDVADGRNSRAWLCTANRPAGRPARRSNISRFSHTHPTPRPPNGRFSNKEWAYEGAWRLFPIWKSDSWLNLLNGKVGLWGFDADRRPSPGSDFIYTKISARPRSGFYLHKECRAAEIWILSTQRIPRGRGPMLISTNVLWGPGLIRV